MKNLLTAAMIAIASPALSAVDYDDETKSLVVSGVTTAYMSFSVSRALEKNEVDTVYMYGPGGSFYDGLKIGRMLRDEGVRIIIPSDKECASACALAAMGANDLFADGVLLYHKPYVQAVDANSTIDEIASMYGRAYIDMAEYIVDMGYDISFARDIVDMTNFCKLFTIKDDFAKRDIDDRCDD